jgi:predicted dehydrogenase
MSGLDRPLRVGFVGCGEHARISLYPSLRAAFGGSPEGLPALVLTQQGRGQPPLLAELVALADHKRDLAERVAAFHGVRRVYTDHLSRLDGEDLDAVIVCMHPRRQAQAAIECLERGVHVWVEKPPAESVAEARVMAEAARRAGKQLAVGYMKRFSYPYRRAKAFTERPEFGTPSVFESRFTYGQYPVDVYRFLNGFATHHLDLPRFFMGEVESVYCERVSRGTGLDGYAITLRFASGGVGLVNVNCLEGEHNNWSERMAVTGVGGRVFVENWRRVIGFLPGTRGRTTGSRRTSGQRTTRTASPFTASWASCATSWRACARAGRRRARSRTGSPRWCWSARSSWRSSAARAYG